MPAPEPDDKIVFFDGLCVLCNRSVNFLLKYDKRKRLKFASLQSEFARIFFESKKFDLKAKDSIVFYTGGRTYIKSTAVIRISCCLGLPWSTAGLLWIIPRPFMDLVYDYISKNRYKWFGKRDTCRLPDESDKSRFIE